MKMKSQMRVLLIIVQRILEIYDTFDIHIYEANYNLMLSVKARELVHHMHDNKLFEEGIYSNRPGYSAIDPEFLEELQNEYCRFT